MPHIHRYRSTSIRSLTLVLSLVGMPAIVQAAVASTVAVSITPASATLAPAKSVQFTATVTGSTNTGVNWTVNGNGGGPKVGTITTSGLYTAPKSTPGNPAPPSVTVAAVSKADPTRSAQ